MQFGAMNFPVLPVLEEIETFARLGFDYVELAMDPPMAHYTTISKLKKKIVQTLEANHLGVVCHLPTFVATADLTDSIRKASILEMRHSLEVAADVGAQKVVLHPSMASGMGAYVLATVKHLALDFVSQMASAARKLDLTLCLENMMPGNRIGVEVDDLEEFFAHAPDLTLTLDTGHANIGDRHGQRLKTLLERFGGRIGHLHISDNAGQRDEHLAVGHGTVDFRALVRHLKSEGYADTITLEVFDTDRRMLVDSREKIAFLFAEE